MVFPRDRRRRRPRQQIAAQESIGAPHRVAATAPQSSTTFTQLGLAPELVRAVSQEGYVSPTPIQAECIPALLQGADIIGCAQTGTGKTAAFVLPILQRLKANRKRRVRALVVVPTRELAAQVAERARAYGKHLGMKCAVIYGGVSQRNQERELREGPEIIVATPGRFLDLLQQGLIRLNELEVLVLDEADTMFDMGFIHDVRRIVAASPKKRQTLLFSATMPGPIEKLARSILTNPVRVAVAPQSTTADKIEQAVYHVAQSAKRVLLESVLINTPFERALVFTRTKHGADRVARQLSKAGIKAEAIHGNKSQGARERTLEAFRQGRLGVLVATDIAARGIDVRGVYHVINFDLPHVAECYVHRIGRTARAGAEGQAISFCNHEEKSLLSGIEKLIRQRIPVRQSQIRAAS